MPDGVYTWSCSQIVDFQLCARKWGFKSVAKVKTEQHPSAALGTETHKQLEIYLGGGQIDYTILSGQIAASGFPYLPDPKTPGLKLEGYFKFQSPYTGFWYNGYRDFYVPAESRPERRPLIGDHKTTSNIKWAKTEYELLTDPQAIIYARNENTDGAVDLRWIYYQTKQARKALPVDVTLEREHVLKEFSKLELTAQEMRGIVDDASVQEDKETFVKSLPPNPSACEMYGGCPYRHLCNLGPEDRLTSLFGKQLKVMEDKMSAGVQSLIERIKASQAGQAPATVQVQANGTVVTDYGPAKGKDTFSQDFINPPPVEAKPETKPEERPTIVPTGEDKPKRTRRTKAEMEAARAAQTTEMVAARGAELVITPSPASGNSEASVSVATPEVGGYTLYVDCMPSTLAEDLSHTINAAKNAVCEKTGKPDYRLVDYGQGAGLLAIAVEDLIDAGAVRGDVFISSQLQETHAVLEVLSRRAIRVVRAIR